MMKNLFRLAILIISWTAHAQLAHPILAIGSAAPDFELPGVDGKNHKLGDYASSAVLVVVFNCNHCPIAQMYERRIAQSGHGLHGSRRECRRDRTEMTRKRSQSTSWIPPT